ncbi:MAG TPA: SPOR domain-containing protein, partial [Gammaproteobacteria bacterium]
QQALAERMAHLQPGDAPGPDQRLAALQAEAAAQQQSLAALRQQLEWALEKVDTSLGQFDARLQQLEQRARTPAAPVAKAAPAAKPAPAAPPAAAASGGFTVVVASFPTRAQAEQSLAALAKAGEPLRLRAAVVDGKTWYRVQAEGFADRAAAQAYARRLASRHGIGGAWVASP